MNVLVTHPGRQHSHQLAMALDERDALSGYWVGVPTADPATKGPFYQMLSRVSPQPTTGISNRVVDHNYVMPLVRRVGEWGLSPKQTWALVQRATAWFDAWAARSLPDGLDAVVCYENSAFGTFQAAKERRITTILDAASFHHAWQDDFYEPVESDTVHQWVNRRKDAEIQLADHILTVSELARESYMEAGVSPNQITTVPMGTDLTVFTRGDSDPESLFTFIFAGYAGRRKGVDLLLSASERLNRAGHPHRVQFAGNVDESFFRHTKARVDRLGYLNRSALADAYRQADCLVLPSRHDSFGRVVVEAMAVGCPAIVSEHVGAKGVDYQERNGMGSAPPRC